MAKYSYGLSSFKVGDIAALDGSPENEVELIEAIYKDTAELNEPEPQETPHYVEGLKDPVVNIQQAGVSTLTFTIVDLSAAMKERFMGGTNTVVDGKDTWHAPDGNVVIEKYITFTTKDGTVAKIPRAQVRGRLTGKVGTTSIQQMVVKATILNPNFAALKAMIFSDPA